MKKIISLLLGIVFITSMISCISPYRPSGNKNNNPIKDEIDKIIYHTISFETNGGSRVYPEEIKTLERAPFTEKDGYLFEGWYLDPTLTQAVIYPLSINKDMTIYAKWLKLKDQSKCKNTCIKFDRNIYYITPNGFDIDRLAELGYMCTITVTYEVYYKKDYDVLWDIGYLGSPKYEISITNSEDIGQFKNNVSTSKSVKEKTITYTCSAAQLKNDKIKLQISTDNIQNKIYFENITVTYEFN